MSTANCAEEDPLIGSRIDGRYTVHRVLGQGGMGVVYEGVHDELGRQVAIKVLNAAWAADRTAVERFLREARTASSFSHSNIVDVSDLGRLADGRPYLVMPKITGVDLATLLAESGPQPAKRVAALLGGVASALDLVHAKGFVHRDIKPENLMYVVREDGSETVMLLDFGIAAAVMSSGPRLTRQGAIFGTPHYLPPEVCAGARCDARGDVYSLAAVAFELITGELPFAAEDIMQLMAQKVTYDAPSLAAVSGATFPAELESVIASGLARDPRYRYTSASEFVSELRAATHSAPVSWKSGVMRPSMRSAEHVLPQRVSPPGWEAERAPTWPIDSSRPEATTPGQAGRRRSGAPTGEPELRFDESSHASYPRRPTPPRYQDDSAVRRSSGGSAGYGTSVPPPAYASGYPAPARSQQASYPPQTMNPGVWAAHAAPQGRGSRDLGEPGAGAYDPRLRVLEDERSTFAVHKRNSTWPVLVGVAAFAALGMGGVHLLAKRSGPQTDARASTHSREVAAEPSHSQSPPATQRSGAAPVRKIVETKPAAPKLTEPTPSPAAPSGAAASDLQALAIGPSHPPAGSTQATAPGNSAPASAPVQQDGQESHADIAAAQSPAQADARPSATASAQPDRRPSGSRAGASHESWAEGAAKVRPVPGVAASDPDPLTDSLPAGTPAASSIVTVTPIAPAQPELSSAPPEPEPSIPQVDSASAADYAKRSSGALLRGEVTRAVDLARRATQSDPSYAIAWRSLGLALERAGTADQAVAAYGEYLQRAPTGPQAEMVRQRMQALSR